MTTEPTPLAPAEAVACIVRILRAHDGEAVTDLEAVAHIVDRVPPHRGRVAIGGAPKRKAGRLAPCPHGCTDPATGEPKLVCGKHNHNAWLSS